jgi:putative ABC transport system substrate-binding protein
MNRRGFITLLGGAAASWPAGAWGQQPGKLPSIGVLGGGNMTSQGPWLAAFVQRLSELGWIERRTISFDIRWAEGRPEQLAEIATEFVRLKVDVIFAIGTDAALAAKRATASVPIVFPVTGDPISTGLVASFARPGGNVTGLSNQARDLGAKRLEMLREVSPAVRKVGLFANAAYAASAAEMSDVQEAGRTLGLEIVPSVVRNTQEIAAAFAALKGRVDALYIVGDPLIHLNRVRINTFALVAHLPTIYPQREYVQAAGLMSYGPNYLDLNRRAAALVDKILRGAKPAEIPVEQPTKFDFVMNLTTAQALNLEISPMLLARADEVIE